MYTPVASSINYLMKGSSTANVSGSDAGSTAESAGGNLVEKDVAEVDLLPMDELDGGKMKSEEHYVCSSDESVCNGISVTNTVIISAAQPKNSEMRPSAGDRE